MALAFVVLAAGALGGCGQPPPDLFEVSRTGDGPGADVNLVVSDGGTVSCNGAEPVALGERLLTARQLNRDLTEAAVLGLELPPGPDPVLSYRVRLESGEVAFSDTSRQKPASFDRLAAFVSDVSEHVCGIEH
jgi:hypothetical protein